MYVYIYIYCLLCYLKNNICLSVYPFQLDMEKICFFSVVGKSFNSIERFKFIFLFIYFVG